LIRRLVLLCCLALSIVITAAAQHSAEAGGHAASEASHELLWKWANFLLLIGILGYFAYKRAGAFFRSRTEAIQRGIQEADRLRREAEARVAEMEQRLANLEKEIEALRAQARQELEAEDRRLQAEAEETIQKIRRQAEQEIAAAAKTARQQVRAHAAELAVRLAAAKVRNRITPALDEQLVLAVLEDLKSKRGTSGKEQN